MKSTIQLFAAAAFSFMMITGCQNDDTTKPGDNTTATNTTEPITPPPPAGEGVMPAPDTSGAAMAKPNPAKKGMKGKVSVTGMKKTANAATMETDKEGIYGTAEVLPAYPGGESALADYFSKNITYPEQASEEGIEGTVTINFVVDERGQYASPMIAGPKLGYGLEEEALRVFNQMPKWTPGQIKGKNVKTRYSLPISFQLY